MLFKFPLFILPLFGLSSLAYRLPTSVIPQHYTINIITNLGDENDNFEFYGDVLIKAIVVDETKNITLHSKLLEIDEKKIKINDDKNLVDSTSVDKENEFFTISLNKALDKDKPVLIHIPFKAKLVDDLAGYYLSSYMDQKTKKQKYLAVTQFESTDARRAFPCFDEPEMKAKFLISLGHQNKYTALSNMNQIKREPIEGKANWSWTRFAETVPMSTYLVAFMVSDFAHEIADKTHSNVTFRIWAREDALKQVQFAKELGPKALSYFEEFFDIPYPLPKQDMAAIPDFAAGAMENWGLITYREAALLYDPEISTASNQQSSANTIVHELAHQWFGNLVTMKWWTDLWLNEGFATYMAAQAVDHLFPEWNYLAEESVNNLITVFDFDALLSSHQISVPVGHPREIAEIFDTISYRKGSFILRMMSLFLGQETLRQGVSKYLLKHKYKNAEQDDLWDSLTTVAHQNKVLPANLTVKTIMDTWTLQTGYPVLNIHRDYQNSKVVIRQHRFLRDVVMAKSASNSWWVPITYTDAEELQFNDTKPKYYLANDGKELTIDGPKSNKDWLLFNLQIGGLYRVNYDEENWRLLSDYLQSEKYENIPEVNRIQLIQDAAALAWTADLNYDIFFNITTYLRQEQSFLPWKAALTSLHHVYTQLKRTSEYGTFKVYIKKLIGPAYKKFGRLTQPEIDEKSLHGVQKIKLQTKIAQTACKFKVDECVADAKQLFNAYKKDPKTDLPKNLRAVIVCSALRRGGEEDWDFMWKQYLNSNVAAEKSSILSNLGCTNEPWLLRRYLEWSIKPDSGIRRQDFVTVFQAVALNDNGFYIAREFFKEKIVEISNFLYPNGKRLTRCISVLANQMISKNEYNWFEKLTQENREIFKDAQQGVDQGLETIKLNLQWQNTHNRDIRNVIARHL